MSSDELNKSKKSRAPVYPFEQRKLIVESLACVDEVFTEESLEKKGDYCQQFGADSVILSTYTVHKNWEIE